MLCNSGPPKVSTPSLEVLGISHLGNDPEEIISIDSLEKFSSFDNDVFEPQKIVTVTSEVSDADFIQ